MDYDFGIHMVGMEIDQVWSFARQIESTMGLRICWRIVSYYQNDFWLEGCVVSHNLDLKLAAAF